MDKNEIHEIYQYLRQNGHLMDNVKVRPRTKFRVPGLKRRLKIQPHYSLDDGRHHKEMIPSLLNSYLKSGAVVCGRPALDKSFKCIDFLTLLDVRDLKGSAKRAMKKDD